MIFLILTKSRIATISAILALMLYWYIILPRPKKTVVTLFTAALFCLLFIIFQDHLVGLWNEGLSMGRTDASDLGELSGRIPLWRELLLYVQARAFAGYGFNGFWTPQHVLAISERLYWGVPGAHSGIFELLLGVGIVGAVFYGLILLFGIKKLITKYQELNDRGYLFALVLVLYFVMVMLAEEIFSNSCFIGFIVTIILLKVGLTSSVAQPRAVTYQTELSGGCNRYETFPCHPSYNQGRFLRETLASVLSQGVPDLEYLVLDGGSQDDSPGIIKEFAPYLAYWRSSPDQGQAAAIHEGFRRSTGNILAWLNADDVLLPGALQHVLHIFQQNPRVQFLYGGCELIDAEGRHIKTLREPGYKKEWQLYVRSCVPQSSAFWRRDLYFEVGGLDTALHYAMDYDLWFKFAGKTTPWVTGKILSRQRQHIGTKTSSNARAMEEEKKGSGRDF